MRARNGISTRRWAARAPSSCDGDWPKEATEPTAVPGECATGGKPLLGSCEVRSCGTCQPRNLGIPEQNYKMHAGLLYVAAPCETETPQGAEHSDY